MCNAGFYCPRSSLARCHKNSDVDFQLAQVTIKQICDENQFVNVFVLLSLIKEEPTLFRTIVPTDERLLCTKYDVRLKTLAMNELLGRPVPKVINLKALFAEAIQGKFSRFDKILGFVNDDDEEIEMLPFEKQLQMNVIMLKLLKAKGTDFDLIVGAIKNFKIEGMVRMGFKKIEEKKRRITKMKLSSQRKLRAVANDFDKSVQVDLDDSKKANDSGKIKTAKDFEHYRKSKRPTRI